jgi:EmrB/QacA subfamily drug resistance transporter
VVIPRGVALLVAGALFMEILDATIITPAIPLIAHSFTVDPLDVNLAMTAYLVTVAVLIPVSGWMSDRFGTRRVFIAAIALFTLASIGCAASMSLTMLVAMRVVQGIGGALMVPVGRLLVLRSTEKRDLVRAIALLTWPALAAPVIAPILGGAVATFGSWRWIFIANIPLGTIGFLFALKLIHGKGHSNPAPLDWRGLAALGTGIAAALIAMEGIRVQGTNWAHVAIGGAVAAVALTVAVLHLLRYRYPLVELRVLRVPTLRITVSAGSLYRLVITAVPFLLPLQFQLAFGRTPIVAGSLVAALFAGNIAIKPFTTPLMRRYGIRRVLMVNGVLSVGCFGLLATLTESTPVALIAVILFLSGAMRSTGFTAYNSLAFSDVEAAELAHANTLNAAVQELAAGIGIAVAAVLLGVFTPISHTAGQAYPWTYLTLGLLIALTLIETLRLPKDAGDAVARQPPRSR